MQGFLCMCKRSSNATKHTVEDAQHDKEALRQCKIKYRFKKFGTRLSRERLFLEHLLGPGAAEPHGGGKAGSGSHGQAAAWALLNPLWPQKRPRGDLSRCEPGELLRLEAKMPLNISLKLL